MAPPGSAHRFDSPWLKLSPFKARPPRDPFLPLPCSRFAYCHCSDEPGQGCLHFGFF